MMSFIHPTTITKKLIYVNAAKAIANGRWYYCCEALPYRPFHILRKFKDLFEPAPGSRYGGGYWDLEYFPEADSDEQRRLARSLALLLCAEMTEE